MVRSSERFSRFLDVAAFCNGEIINFTKIANDSGVPARTVQEYFGILEDTLLGYRLQPLQTLKRKNVATAKFYFFDIGIANYLLGRESSHENSESFGRILEHMIFLEIKAYLDYTLSDSKIQFWRTHTQSEVDFVVNKTFAIEVKAAKNISASATRHLDLLAEESFGSKLKKIIVCREKSQRKLASGTVVFHYRDFLQRLWAGNFF